MRMAHAVQQAFAAGGGWRHDEPPRLQRTRSLGEGRSAALLLHIDSHIELDDLPADLIGHRRVLRSLPVAQEDVER